jgi:hypothetical protein
MKFLLSLLNVSVSETFVYSFFNAADVEEWFIDDSVLSYLSAV